MKNSDLINAIIEVTDHSLIQLVDRWHFDSYAHIIASDEVLLYPDVDESSNVFYLNIFDYLDKGFLVLRKTKENKFVVITITRSERRDFGDPIKLINPILNERQIINGDQS